MASGTALASRQLHNPYRRPGNFAGYCPNSVTRSASPALSCTKISLPMRLPRIALPLTLIASAASPPDPVELRIMTYNIWYGGVQVDFNQTIAAIRLADPDIAGLQEPDGNTQAIAAAAGYSPDLYNSLAFAYTGATLEGDMTRTPDLYDAELTPGHYKARLMADDHYAVQAVAPFTVTE